ncbi:cleft lip and palate transmembrane protein 1 [Lingula anatina]|uniref:Cleft lip and palate transmembrane protein 1 n=1 Tax=Lingula anatina TaxID=7574 RepID=A0A1S3IUZ1_LINAN|nr:cleft lip and palate transmembrane protein 1 [Lingula anatina]|eukprot:XP_013401359.1 cleft lip and palate transmembrane protein 1 [Lingula anatina]
MAEKEVSAAEGASNNSSNTEVAATDGGENSQETQAAPQQPQANGWSMVKGFFFRCLVIYFISSLFRRGQQPQMTTTPDGKSVPMPTKLVAHNIFEKGQMMDMYVYLSEDETFKDFGNPKALFWLEEDLEYGDWTSGENKDGTYTKEARIKTPERVMNNGSLYLHTYFVKRGNSPNPKDKDTYDKWSTIYKKKMLNKYKKRKFHSLTNLLTGQTEAHPDLIQKENGSSFEILSHWHPNLTINLLEDYTPWTAGAVPQPLDEFVEFLPDGSKYLPILYYNDYWNLNSDYQPINDTVKYLNISLTYSPITLFKWQLYAAQGMRNKWYSSILGDDMVGESDEEQDSLKRTFVETNPYLLALTFIVSIVHSVFEFLAFKNDIQFWKNRKSLEGLSVRSVFFNVFQSLIVVLYVLDNETNTIVRISVFIGLLIEVWKIHKVMDIKTDQENRVFGIFPRISLQDKSSYTESHTKEYDQMAFKYLSWALYPLLGGYAVYSLMYVEQKGWYSWVLSMLYGFLLTFGFIMMTPQLFINYKLKSVAHLPWRMLTYKFLNTFIDDIFAFVIKMPTLYRIGCFRDDIVFLIFIYQRWIYRVDPSRVNEFGTSGEMEETGAIGANGDALPAVEDGEPKTEEDKKRD